MLPMGMALASAAVSYEINADADERLPV
jgi:hypothetical protein